MYIQQIRDEHRTLLVVNEYLNICVMKQNRKKKKSFSPLFHQEGRQFRHHHFIFILFSVWGHRVLESWNASLWCIFRPRKKISTRNDIISSSSSSIIIIIIIMRCFCFSAEEEVPPPPRVVVVILRDHPSKKKK